MINKYYIAAEGIKYFPKARPTCTFAQSDESPKYNKKCKAAIVGDGTIANAFGAATDPTAKAGCDVKLTLINISNGPGVTKKRGGMRFGSTRIRLPARCRFTARWLRRCST